MDDDWPNCDAEAVVAALSARYRFSRANAVQLLCDEGILRPRAGAEHDDDEEVPAVMIPMPGHDLVSFSAVVVGMGEHGFQDGAAAAAMFRYGNGNQAPYTGSGPNFFFDFFFVYAT